MVGAASGVGIPAGLNRSMGVADLIGVGLASGGAATCGVRVPTGVPCVAGTDCIPDGVALREDVAANSSPPRSPPSIVMTEPQTEQRARTLDAGIRAGSTRNTERHS